MASIISVLVLTWSNPSTTPLQFQPHQFLEQLCPGGNLIRLAWADDLTWWRLRLGDLALLWWLGWTSPCCGDWGGPRLAAVTGVDLAVGLCGRTLTCSRWPGRTWKSASSRQERVQSDTNRKARAMVGAWARGGWTRVGWWWTILTQTQVILNQLCQC